MGRMQPYLPQAPTTPGPAAPAPPQAPAPVAPPVTSTPSFDFPIPRTAQEIANLRARRDVISSQIENVRSRRNTIARQYESATGANRSGLDQQLRILDQRLSQLELDLAQSGRALALGTQVSTSLGTPYQFPFVNPGQITGISIVFIIFVLGPLAMSAAKVMWRRAARPVIPPGWFDASQRLERLEHAVDTIAIEMERVSEGQRFITKIMTQRDGSAPNAEGSASGTPGLQGGQALPALGAGSPEPIVFQNQQQEVRVRRS